MFLNADFVCCLCECLSSNNLLFCCPVHQAAGCDAEGSAIKFCAEAVTYNGVNLEETLGGLAGRRHLEADSSSVLDQMLELEVKYSEAIARVRESLQTIND